MLAETDRWAGHLESVLGVPLGGAGALAEWPPPAAIRPARRGLDGPGGEVLLWHSIENAAPLERSGIRLDGDGPLWPQSAWAAVEVWTEAELCGVHALWRAARLRNGERAAIHRRIANAVRWHLEYTQPDNATNRPWALHVFLSFFLREGRHDGRLYAATLLHNAQAQGLEDPASGWILADVARELRMLASGTEPFGAAGASGNE